jgi:hypothetical protein
VSEPRRAIVVDPQTQRVVNAILVDPERPIELPGQLVIEDEWGAGPGDAWDPEQRRPFRPVAEVLTGQGEPVVVLADQRRAIVESRRPDIEDALLRGDTEAAMAIILQVDRAIRELEASLGPGEVQ